MSGNGSTLEFEAIPEMCAHCFDTLIEDLQKQGDCSFQAPKAKVTSLLSLFNESEKYVKCPLFVTWNKQRRNSNPLVYDLRGCIGSLEPRTLHSAVADYALISALNDRRFRPINSSELPELQVGVSLLVNYEDCDTSNNATSSSVYDCFEWTVGKHGIIIKFQDRGGRSFSATYLPEVAKELSWSQEEAIHSLVRKSGYSGKIDEDLLKSIRCTRYQSSKSVMTYDEYIRFEPKSR